MKNINDIINEANHKTNFGEQLEKLKSLGNVPNEILKMVEYYKSQTITPEFLFNLLYEMYKNKD